MSIEDLKGKAWENSCFSGERWFNNRVIKELLDYPAQLNDSELDVLGRKKRVDEKKEQLDIKEFSLLASGIINGSNAETRKAQLKDKAIGERSDLKVAEEALSSEEANHKLIENEFKALLAISQIIGGR